MTSDPRNTSKACVVQKFQSQFSRQVHDWRHSHHTVSEVCMFHMHIQPKYRDNSVLARNRTSQSLLGWYLSDRQHRAVEFICNPVSSYFHSQHFIFMRLSSLTLP